MPFYAWMAHGSVLSGLTNKQTEKKQHSSQNNQLQGLMKETFCISRIIHICKIKGKKNKQMRYWEILVPSGTLSFRNAKKSMAISLLLWTQRRLLGHCQTLFIYLMIQSFSSCPHRLSSCSVRFNEVVEGWVMDQSRTTERLLPVPLLNTN